MDRISLFSSFGRAAVSPLRVCPCADSVVDRGIILTATYAYQCLDHVAETCSPVIRLWPSLTLPMEPWPMVFPSCQLPNVRRDWDLDLATSTLGVLGDA